MARFAGDPDYALEWPPRVFQDELRRLIARGRRSGANKQWEDEILTLFNQAFLSSVPEKDFRATVQGAVTNFGYDDEPF